MILLLLNVLLQYSIHFIQTLCLDRMRMEWIKDNSVGKQKLLRKKTFVREFQVVLFTRFCWYSSLPQKQLNNEIKQNKRNHVNVCNAAYIKSYLASCFKQVKHVQNLSVKNSKSLILILKINK